MDKEGFLRPQLQLRSDWQLMAPAEEGFFSSVVEPLGRTNLILTCKQTSLRVRESHTQNEHMKVGEGVLCGEYKVQRK